MRPRREWENPDPMKPGGGTFNTTRWSIVCAVTDPDDARAGAALDELCRIYWQPLYAYARRAGQNHDDAADAVQGFITDCVEKRKLGKANQVRGRFRNFLLTAFKHFLINEWEKRTARRRCNGAAVLTIDDLDRLRRDDPSLCHQLTAEQVFTIRWRQTIIAQATARLGWAMMDDVDRSIFEAFQARYEANNRAAPGYATLALELGISEQNVKTRMCRLRLRLRKIIEEEIRQTVCSESEFQEELNELKRGSDGT
jgi:RNA polymerase sigma-70 factor (ECF subfamily)